MSNMAKWPICNDGYINDHIDVSINNCGVVWLLYDFLYGRKINIDWPKCRVILTLEILAACVVTFPPVFLSTLTKTHSAALRLFGSEVQLGTTHTGI